MMDENLAIARVVIGLSILGVAAASDLKTRTVANKFWILMGALGMALLAGEILMVMEPAGSSLESTYDYPHLLILVTVGILFFDVFWDREPIFGKKFGILPVIFYTVAAVCALLMVWLEGFGSETIGLLVIPVMIILAYGFYYTGLLHGGADAKAFMALAILFPAYPIFNGDIPLISYPSFTAENLQLVFPFAFLILMNAAIIQVLFVPLAMVLRNISRKDIGFPEMLLGYRMDIDQIPKKFVWPMEVVRNEEVVVMLFPKRLKDVKTELDELRKRGIENIWVTPKVPFIVPMLFGLLFSFFVGNVIMFFF